MTMGHWPVLIKSWKICKMLFAFVFTKGNMDELPVVMQRLQGQENKKLCSFTVTLYG